MSAVSGSHEQTGDTVERLSEVVAVAQFGRLPVCRAMRTLSGAGTGSGQTSAWLGSVERRGTQPEELVRSGGESGTEGVADWS